MLIDTNVHWKMEMHFIIKTELCIFSNYALKRIFLDIN